MKPCIKCGATNRYKNGKCKPCNNRGTSTWKAKHPDKLKVYQDDNKEKINFKKVNVCAADYRLKTTII